MIRESGGKQTVDEIKNGQKVAAHPRDTNRSTRNDVRGDNSRLWLGTDMRRKEERTQTIAGHSSDAG